MHPGLFLCSIHGISLVLPCHLLATVTSAVGGHREAQVPPTSFSPVLSHPFPACCTQRAFPCNPSAMLPPLFYIRLRPRVSFSILSLFMYDARSSFASTPPCTEPWPLTFPLVSATCSWSLSLALPLSWDRNPAWYFHSCYVGRQQPLYWRLATAQWSSARPAA